MKLTYITLHNFASIFVGMKLKKLHIDLSKGINVIALLVGPNGSGKTSILSNLHPFAYPGSMDVRSGTELILENHDGYKEVGIRDNDGSEYTIKHFYMFKNKNRTMKSFISKNGVEMNPNGNVSSFMEVVQLELGLEPEFLKLLRLGSNVTSFINMKSLDRKKFTSQLLSDVDIYTTFYKKVNDDSRALKTLIKSATDKLSRLNIQDLDRELDEQDRITKKLKELNATRDNIMMEIGNIQSSIQSLEVDSVSELNSKILSCDTAINTMQKQLKALDKTIEKLGDISIDDAIKERDKLSNKLNVLDKELSSIAIKTEMYLNELNMLFEQRDAKESNLKFIDSSEQLDKLKTFKEELNNEIRELNEELRGYNKEFSITKEEALTLISMLNDLKYAILDVLSVNPKNELDEFFKYADKNIKSVIKKKVDVIDKQMLIINMQLSQDINELGKNELQVMYRMCEYPECPYVAYYNSTSTKVVSKKEELQSRLSKLDSQRTFYSNVLSIDEYMNTIKYILNINDKLIKISPFAKDINHQLITKCLKSNSNDPIDEIASALRTYVTKIECKYEIDDKVKALENVDREMDMFNRNAKTLDIVKDDINNILNRINELGELVNNNNEKSKEIENRVIDIDSRIYDLNTLIESSDIRQDTLVSIGVMQVEKNNILDKINRLSELESNLKQTKTNLLVIDNESDRLSKIIEENNRRIREYKVLQEELKTLNDKYEDIEIIKESLSSNKGIPLLYIQLYLRSTRKFINELLDVVYGGDLQIESFIVNEKEFRIPYSKNGVLVDDVIYASDGERAFISLIISLALIKQTINKYDILLLDEVDAALDSTNRSKFLGILELYIKEIGCEQLFMITHNNAFDNYDVDLIVTGNTDAVDTLSKVNTILYKR